MQLFSDRQLDHAGEINARGHPYNVVPPRFDPDKDIDWSPVWSLTQGRHRYLPTSMLYGMTPEQRGDPLASGPIPTAARPATRWKRRSCRGSSSWWSAMPSRSGGTTGCASLPWTWKASATTIWQPRMDYYRGHHRDMWVLDVTSDLGIPAFVALSRRTDVETEDIIYGAGAHTWTRTLPPFARCAR